jgi:hypothetical protein
MMNGFSTTILLSVIGGLITLANVLFGLVLKAHKDRDDERWAEMNAEMLRLRNRFHEIAGIIGKVDQWQRFRDEDNK